MMALECQSIPTEGAMKVAIENHSVPHEIFLSMAEDSMVVFKSQG